jgi:hypothetical protein
MLRNDGLNPDGQGRERRFTTEARKHGAEKTAKEVHANPRLA